MLTRHVGKGGGEEATMETRRSTRSTRSKRALEPTDDENEVKELQRAVKRLNTGGDAVATTTSDVVSGNSTRATVGNETEAPALRSPSPTRPPMDEHEPMSADSGPGSLGAGTTYAEINSMLRGLHFARLERRPMPPTRPGEKIPDEGNET